MKIARPIAYPAPEASRKPGSKRDFAPHIISEYDEPAWITLDLTTIRFDTSLKTGGVLTDFPILANTGKEYFTALDNNRHPLFKNLAPSVIEGRTRTVLTLLKHLAEKGYESLTKVPASGWKELRLRIEKGLSYFATPPTAESILEKFRVLHDLWLLGQTEDPNGSYLITHGLSFKPFRSFQDAVNRAKKVGVAKGTTEDIPPDVLFHYLDCSIRYICEYAPDIIRLQKQSERETRNNTANVPAHSKEEERLQGLARLLCDFAATPSLATTNGARLDPHALASMLKWRGSDTILTQRSTDLIRIWENAFLGNRHAPGRALEQLRRVADLGVESVDLWHAPPQDLSKRLQLPFDGLHRDTGHPWPIRTIRSSAWATDSLEKAVARLWTSIYIVIAACLADRNGETLDLDIDCITKAVDGKYLTKRVFKDKNAEGGSALTLPAPEIVDVAVKVAIELGENARNEGNSTKLFFERNRLGTGVPDETTIRKRLAEFSADMVVGTEFEAWPLTGMVIRRFFATAWVNYFDYGRNFRALMRFMGHSDLTSTVVYAASRVKGEVLTDRQRRLALNIFNQAAVDGRTLLGPYGKKFAKFLDTLRIRVRTNEEMVDTLTEFVKAEEIRIFPMSHGYCAWGAGAQLVAKCAEAAGKRSSLWPEIKKTLLMCGACARFLYQEVFRSFLETSLEMHEHVAADPRAPHKMKAAARAGVKMHKAYLKRRK